MNTLHIAADIETINSAIKEQILNEHDGKYRKVKDLGHVCVACAPAIDSHDFVMSFCGNPFNADYDPEIMTLLNNRVGALGDYDPYRALGLHGSVGSCAEPHAADAVVKSIKKVGLPFDIREFAFSRAYVTHPAKVRDYCAICRRTFLQLNIYSVMYAEKL